MSNTATATVRPAWRFFFIGLCAVVAVWGLGWSALRIATEGVGVLGVNNGIPWGWDIVMFVFWIGLGHAGTLISSVLLLTGQKWRLPIARHAELMTLCAVCTAAVFPLVHVGRAWMLWQMAPIPVASGVWPNMASALVWDAAAITAYLLLSGMYWYMGIARERPSAARHRHPLAGSCLLMAGVLTPLVITVHSIVGSDFAVTFRWQSVLIPAYFVCGAILSGMAVVQLIAVWRNCPAPTLRGIGKLTLALSCAMGLFYLMELTEHPQFFGPQYTAIIVLNVILPVILLSIRKQRFSKLCMAAASCSIILGMWAERVHIIITRSELKTGFSYTPSAVDAAMLIGSVGLFLMLYMGISARMPEERTDARDDARACNVGAPARAAGIGFSLGAIAAVSWSLLTQEVATAGILSSRPHGLIYHIPAIFVTALLGAGLGIFIHFIHTLRRP